jgi:hypothetical protein
MRQAMVNRVEIKKMFLGLNATIDRCIEPNILQ